ncbi:MAG: hydroxymethylbilane synthase, partial [Verrucomicrobiales bacterium]|nr:hydroxymethylbilane synthase [Verrucomicrobiales bacterium]
QGDNPVVDKGIFTKELEEALLRREIDFAVHSLKDVPTELGPEFEICATLPRADIADVFLTTQEGLGDDLTLLGGKVIATSAVRRARQLRWLCPGVEVADIRGNVPTRIRKMIESTEWDAILLARAGIERLGIYKPGETSFDFEGTTVHAHELDTRVFLPAAGQGAVGMEILRDNDTAREALAKINDAPTFCRVTAERSFLGLLKAGCQTPVGAHTWFEADGATLAMAVRVFDESHPQAEPFVAEVRGAAADPAALAEMLMNLKSKNIS